MAQATKTAELLQISVRGVVQGRVTIKAIAGASRVVDMLTGELLPRIC